MNLDKIKSIYFLGIGGIGMSALARYFHSRGKHIWGYDKTRTALTAQLEAEGMAIHYEENVPQVQEGISSKGLGKDDLLVVITPAVPSDHAEMTFLAQAGYVMKKRSEVLGMITAGSFTIAVAGTHGKTTTSSLIAHILRTAGIDCTAFLGGITQNYNTNLLIGKHPTTVVEADEYDRSFLTLHPDIAVITSVDADHLDIYGSREFMHQSYDLFAGQVKPGGRLILRKGVEEALKTATGKSKVISYSLQDGTDLSAQNIAVRDGKFSYAIADRGRIIPALELGIPGRHNIENSIAAVAAAREMGVDDEAIRKALASFRGVKRRFEYHIRRSDLVYIDDYAHHPEELKACITAIRELYPGRRITGVFQPHLYSRTRDFADEFALSLGLLDEVILMEIYPARELPIPGVSAQMLLDKIPLRHKKICGKDELVSELKGRKLDIVLTAGAGDIDQFVEPITKALEK
ncbi:MAG: UDP-N-acetylmuramate--L-alanine ligase [Bacteroidota bacterium]